jgi:hypothetical protein
VHGVVNPGKQATADALVVKKHPDGSLRTPDGKFAGSDGTSRSGAEAEAAVHDGYRKLGYEVDERQQYTMTPVAITGEVKSGKRKGSLTLPPGTVRKYDGAVKMLDGNWYGIETKGGTASKSPEQRLIDAWLDKPGNSLSATSGKTLVGVREATIKY